MGLITSRVVDFQIGKHLGNHVLLDFSAPLMHEVNVKSR